MAANEWKQGELDISRWLPSQKCFSLAAEKGVLCSCISDSLVEFKKIKNSPW